MKHTQLKQQASLALFYLTLFITGSLAVAIGRYIINPVPQSTLSFIFIVTYLIVIAASGFIYAKKKKEPSPLTVTMVSIILCVIALRIDIVALTSPYLMTLALLTAYAGSLPVLHPSADTPRRKRVAILCTVVMCSILLIALLTYLMAALGRTVN